MGEINNKTEIKEDIKEDIKVAAETMMVGTIDEIMTVVDSEMMMAGTIDEIMTVVDTIVVIGEIMKVKIISEPTDKMEVDIKINTVETLTGVKEEIMEMKTEATGSLVMDNKAEAQEDKGDHQGEKMEEMTNRIEMGEITIIKITQQTSQLWGRRKKT